MNRQQRGVFLLFKKQQMKELGRLWIHLRQSKPQKPRLNREERQNFLIEIKKLEEDVRSRTESREEIIKYSKGLKKRRK